MYHDPELVKKVIQSQELTRLIAYEIGSSDQIDKLTGTQAELCQRLDYLMQVVPGPFRIECGTKDDVIEKGGRGANRQPFTWKLNPLHGKHEERPASAPAAPIVVPAAKVPDGYLSPREHELALELERIKRRTMCEHDVPYSQPCRACDDADEDEEEEEEEEEDAPQQEIEKTRELVTLVREVIREFRGTVPPPKAIAGPIDDTMTPEDLETMRAVKRMAASNPEDFKAYRDQLLQHYGDKATEQ